MVLNRKCRAWRRAALGRTGREGGKIKADVDLFPLPGERVRERGRIQDYV